MKSTKKIGVGILGLSNRGIYFADQHIKRHPDCELVGVCDLVEDKVIAAQKRFSGLAGTTSIDQFLEIDGLDAVIIATPDKVHAENALAVLKAGKHIFLEKPMAQTIEDCDLLIDKALKSGKVFMVGLELRYCSLFQDMKKLIDEGEIGRVVMGNVVDNVSVGGDYYYHGLKSRKDYIKSLTLEKGTHSLDLVNWMIGSSPIRVFSSSGLNFFGGNESPEKRCRSCEDAATCEYYLDVEKGKELDYGPYRLRDDLCVYSSEVDVDDNAIVLIDYENGARVTYSDCMFTPEYSREFTFIGTKGKMYGFYNNEQEFRIEVQKRNTRKKEVYYPVRGSGSHGGGDKRIIQQFINNILKNRVVFPGLKGARDSAAIAIAAAMSAESGLPVDIRVKDIPDTFN